MHAIEGLFAHQKQVTAHCKTICLCGSMGIICPLVHWPRSPAGRGSKAYTYTGVGGTAHVAYAHIYPQWSIAHDCGVRKYMNECVLDMYAIYLHCEWPPDTEVGMAK